MRVKNFILFSLLMILVNSCSANNNSGLITSNSFNEEDMFFKRIDEIKNFAEEFYKPVDSDITPQMSEVGLPFKKEEIINISEIIKIVGLDQVNENLLNNGFCVYKRVWETDNPINAFENLEYYGQPVYVSSGIPLHLMHIFFDQLLQNVEQQYVYKDLIEILTLLYKKNIERKNFLNAGYLGVALKILLPEFEIDDRIKEKVLSEIELITKHEGFAESPVFGYKEDYSQYVPRGHYTANDTLKRYFNSMMYLGRITFLLVGNNPDKGLSDYIVSEEEAKVMTASALILISDLCSIEGADGELLIEKWEKIYGVTAFFAGFADDLSVTQYIKAVTTISGENPSSEELYSNEFYEKFCKEIKKSCSFPRIYSGTGELVAMPDEMGEFQENELERAFAKTTGFRLFGQRFAYDSEILGLLVFPTIGGDISGRFRFMPSGLDVAAAFGGEAAYNILCERGDTTYGNYREQLEKLKNNIGNLSENQWHKTLYNSWLHTIYLLQNERGEGYPDFMQTNVWNIHTLSNFLSSWAMLRHDNILYVKQSYTMEAGCAPNNGGEEPVPSAGFVEPVPEVYAEISSVLQMAKDGLKDYEMLSDNMDWQIDRALDLMKTLQNIAEKELRGEFLSEQDANFLKYFAQSLQGAIDGGEITEEGLETSLIADVHTDQNTSSVLEVASGNLDYAVIIYKRADGVIEAAIGPVLSYYEFTWAMGDRLTDEKWRTMLDEEIKPNRPEWIYIYDKSIED